MYFLLGSWGGNFQLLCYLWQRVLERIGILFYFPTWLCKVVLPLSQRCWQLFFVQHMFLIHLRKIMPPVSSPLTSCWARGTRGMTIEVCAWSKGQWFIWFMNSWYVCDCGHSGNEMKNCYFWCNSNRWLVFCSWICWNKKAQHCCRNGRKSSTVGGVRNQRVFSPAMQSCTYPGSWECNWTQELTLMITLQGINISHLGKRKIIFKMPFLGDMLVPWRVDYTICIESDVFLFALFGDPSVQGLFAPWMHFLRCSFLCVFIGIPW